MTSAAADPLLIEREGEIVWLRFNRPDKLNAFDAAQWERLRAVFTELDGDETIRCILLTGADARAFSAGADIAELQETAADPSLQRRYGDLTRAAIGSIAACRHPVVAVISGLCVGGGLVVAINCDLRICGAGARFGVPVKRLGLAMPLAEEKALVDLVGPANALEILLEGRLFEAQEAQRMGLVNRVVQDSVLVEEATATAQRIAEGAPLVARWHKKFVRRLLDPTPLTRAELDESLACFATEDFRTGVEAFLAKTQPSFRGR